MNNGYDVFRNVSQHGIADIIALDPDTGEVVLIDVKSPLKHLDNDGTVRYYNKPSEEQRSVGVKLLLVTDVGCMWSEETAAPQ